MRLARFESDATEVNSRRPGGEAIRVSRRYTPEQSDNRKPGKARTGFVDVAGSMFVPRPTRPFAKGLAPVECGGETLTGVVVASGLV